MTINDYRELAKERKEVGFEPEPPKEPVGDWRRCIFRHDVPANRGYEIAAGFVCYGHAAEFEDAG